MGELLEVIDNMFFWDLVRFVITLFFMTCAIALPIGGVIVAVIQLRYKEMEKRNLLDLDPNN